MLNKDPRRMNHRGSENVLIQLIRQLLIQQPAQPANVQQVRQEQQSSLQQDTQTYQPYVTECSDIDKGF